MTNVNLNGENILAKGFNNGEWEDFVKGELLVFMEKNGLEKITIDDGNGKKARLGKNKNGEYKVNITYNETM